MPYQVNVSDTDEVLAPHRLGIALHTRSAANVAQRTFVIVRRLIPGASAREAKDKSPPPGLPS